MSISEVIKKLAMEIIQKQLEELLVKSVQKVVDKIERPFGLLLSGGIDSGFLAALSKPDITLTAKFEGGEKYDEFPYAKMTVGHLGLKQEVVEVGKEQFESNFRDAVLVLGEPTYHFSLVPLYLLFKRAHELGLRTVLSAEGPDEYLGGYASYSFLIHEQKLYEQEELKNYHSALDKYLGTAMERFAKILHTEPYVLQAYWDKYDNLLSKLGYTDLQLRGIEKMEQALAKYFDIELLYPFMSPEIEEFCFMKVPDEFKIQDFTTKYIERKIAEKYLPKEVVWRKNKMGGPVAPVGLWLNQQDEFDKTKYVKMQWEILKPHLYQ